jgi:hypothetical protein
MKEFEDQHPGVTKAEFKAHWALLTTADIKVISAFIVEVYLINTSF